MPTISGFCYRIASYFVGELSLEKLSVSNCELCLAFASQKPPPLEFAGRCVARTKQLTEIVHSAEPIGLDANTDLARSAGERLWCGTIPSAWAHSLGYFSDP